MTTRIQIDYRNMMADYLGNRGITTEQLKELQSQMVETIKTIQEKRQKGEYGFLSLPYDSETAEKIVKYADGIQGKYENFIVCGIGGSSLGNIFLQNALNHMYYNLLPENKRPRLFFAENVDPDDIHDLLDTIDLKKTLVNVISKSGGTAETMANYLVLRERLIAEVGEENLKNHIVMTTDSAKGFLRPMVEKEGFDSFVIPANVGGRFSVLTPVGLLSAAVCGIDIKEILAGAASMDKACMNEDYFKNPALIFAGLMYLSDTVYKRNVVVMMPYSNHLKTLSDWFCQLWAESIGKENALDGSKACCGQTPVKSLGAIDQHSQVQLYAEGPDDKVVAFLRVKNFSRQIKIPALYSEVEGINYLGGSSLNELINFEQSATAVALTDKKKPNLTIHLEKIDAFAIGELIMLFEMATVAAGALYGIDPFDQPGVEAGKIATYALMGRKGYETQQTEIQEKIRQDSRYLI